METKLANVQDALHKFFEKLDYYNEGLSKKQQYTYETLRNLDDNTLQSHLDLTKKEVQAWRRYQDQMVVLDEAQQKRVLLLIKGLLVLRSLVNIYNSTEDRGALTSAQDIIKAIKKLDTNSVFASIQQEFVSLFNDSKRKQIKAILRAVRGNLSSSREIGFAAQSIVKMFSLISTTDIKQIKDVLDGKRRTEFLDLVRGYEKSKSSGDFEIVKVVGSVKITGATSMILQRMIASAVKEFGGSAIKNASETQNIARQLSDISEDSSLSVSEKIRKQREVLEVAYADLETEQLDGEELEDRMDSLRVLKAMAEAEVLIQPSTENPIARDMGLTLEQEDAMLSEGRTIISAGAGSGKTRVLSAKVANLLRDENITPFNIVAVSFSRKSAKDLQEKIKSSVGEKIPNIQTTALGRTTHSLAIEFINRFDPNASETVTADEFQSEQILRKAIKLSQEVSSGSVEPESVGFFDQKIDVFKSKKQDDIRILNLLISAQRWIEGKGYAKGGTIRLQEIAKKYISTSEVSKSDIDFVNELLGYNRGQRAMEKAFGGDTTKIKKYTFPSYKNAVKTASANEERWWGVKDLLVGKTKVPSLKACKLFITKAKSQMLTPSQAWEKVSSVGAEYDIKARIYGCYQHLLEGEGLMDFDDVLIKGVQVLNTAGNLKKVQDQYKHIIVDEAQDLNPVQHAFFGLMAGTHTSGKGKQGPQPVAVEDQNFEGKSFTLVGDENQSIYGFRGATQKEFSSKAEKNAGDFNLKQIGINFRSGTNIVEAANRLANTDAEGSLGLSCVASFKDQKDTIKHDKHENVGKASRDVASHIKSMTEGEFTDGSPSDFGIACRTNAEIIPYALALLEKGVPFKSGVNPFNHRSTKAIVRVLGLLTENTGLQMSALYNFHKDLKFNIKNIDGLVEVAKKESGESNYKKIASAIDHSMAFLAGQIDDDPNENLTDYIADNYDEDELMGLYRYFDMVTGFIEEGSKIPSEAFDIALGYKPYANGQFVQSPNGKKLHEILGEHISKKEQATLKSYEPDEDISEDDVIDAEVEGTAQDQVELSVEEQKEYALAPLPALRQLFLTASQNQEGFEQIFAKIDKMRKDADSQSSISDDEDVVVLDTVHGWKGLEVKNLYVPMVQGTFPSKRSTFDPLVHESQEQADAERDEQERKLAYVAVTRGMSNVTVLSYEKSTTGDDLEDSSFINDMGICNTTHKTASERKLATALDILSEYAVLEDDDMTDAEFEEATKGL